MSINIAYLYST